MLSSGILFTAVCAAFALQSPSYAGITAWLDYTDFDTRLGELAATATVTPYTTDEQTLIRANILSDLQDIYSGFDVSFTEVRPLSGDYERLVWGLSTTQKGLLGLADSLDLRNLSRNDVSRVYTANFAGFVSEFDGVDQRDAQLGQLSRTLAGTAAHELAHNLGIEHCDCYACAGISPANYADTNGWQNNQISATGGTGLREEGREALRSFSFWERVKLSYAEGLLADPPPVLAEQTLVHDSLATAQNVSLTDLTATDAASAFITGAISAANESDYFSFTLLAGQSLTARVHSQTLGRSSDRVDSFMSLLAPSGEVLFEDDNIEYNGNVLNSGLESDRYSLDTFFVNIPVAQDGTYTLAVRGVGGDTGAYEFVVAVYNQPLSAVVVPETSTFALGAAGFLLGSGLFWRRRAWRHL